MGDKIAAQRVPQLLSAYTEAARSGRPVCPPPYKEPDKPWYADFWDFVSGAVDRVVKAFDAVKSAVVNIVAEAIPGDLCNPPCRDALMTGLNAGSSGVGDSARVANLKELTDQGMDYLIEVAAAEAQIPCGSECQDGLRRGIGHFVDVANQTVLSTYQDEATAHAHGFEPLWIPAGIQVEPHPDTTRRPPKVVVKIKQQPRHQSTQQFLEITNCT